MSTTARHTVHAVVSAFRQKLEADLSAQTVAFQHELEANIKRWQQQFNGSHPDVVGQAVLQVARDGIEEPPQFESKAGRGTFERDMIAVTIRMIESGSDPFLSVPSY